jgi:hypothetical protein
MTIRSLLGRAYRSSLADAVNGATKLVKERISGPVEPSPMTAAFLRSHDYDELMTRHLPCDGSFDLHEAQNQTLSYKFRHGEAVPRLGVFRWRGMQKHRHRVLELVEKAQGSVLDFGGAGGPLGLGGLVVDQLDRDVLGRPVELHSLADVRGRASVVFSSHALEHVPPLDSILQQMRESLIPGGTLIIHVPSSFCERWRAGLHSSKRFNDHVWTFGLEDAPRVTGLQSYTNIAARIQAFFNVELAEYCGDDSIFVLAHAV